MPLQGMGPQFDPVRVYHFTVRSAITSPYYSTRTFYTVQGWRSQIAQMLWEHKVEGLNPSPWTIKELYVLE